VSALLRQGFFELSGLPLQVRPYRCVADAALELVDGIDRLLCVVQKWRPPLCVLSPLEQFPESRRHGSHVNPSGDLGQ
jgi:hypothetical protein